MSTLSTERIRSATPSPSDVLTEQLARTTDLRWQAVLTYLRGVEQAGGKARIVRDFELAATLLRTAGTPLGDRIAYLTRDTDDGRKLEAVPSEQLAARRGEWILHGWDGSEDLWQVVAHYRYVAAVTDPDDPSAQVHVLLRLEA